MHRIASFVTGEDGERGDFDDADGARVRGGKNPKEPDGGDVIFGDNDAGRS